MAFKYDFKSNCAIDSDTGTEISRGGSMKDPGSDSVVYKYRCVDVEILLLIKPKKRPIVSTNVKTGRLEIKELPYCYYVLENSFLPLTQSQKPLVEIFSTKDAYEEFKRRVTEGVYVCAAKPGCRGTLLNDVPDFSVKFVANIGAIP